MELYDTGNSQDAALVFSELLLVLGSPLGDSWRAPSSGDNSDNSALF